VKKDKKNAKEESDSDSSSDDEPVKKTPGKKDDKQVKQPVKKDTPVPAKTAAKKAAKVESSDDDDSSEDEKPTKKQTPAPATKKETPVAKKETPVAKKEAPAKKETPAAKKPVEESSDSSDSEEEKTVKAPAKAQQTKKEQPKNKKPVEKKEESSEESSEDEETNGNAEVNKKRKIEENGVTNKNDDEDGDELKIKKPKTEEASSRIYVGNLSFDINEEGIRAAFKDIGEITLIDWMEDKRTGKFRGAGFLTFKDPETANKSLALNGTELLGRQMKIELSKPNNRAGDRPRGETPTKPAEPTNTIFLGNLPFDVTEDDIHALFKESGTVKDIRWLNDKNTGEFKGCGFVEFEEDTSSDKAVVLNGTDLKGRSIRVDYSTPRRQDSNGGGGFGGGFGGGRGRGGGGRFGGGRGGGRGGRGRF